MVRWVAGLKNPLNLVFNPPRLVLPNAPQKPRTKNSSWTSILLKSIEFLNIFQLEFLFRGTWITIFSWEYWHFDFYIKLKPLKKSKTWCVFNGFIAFIYYLNSWFTLGWQGARQGSGRGRTGVNQGCQQRAFRQQSDWHASFKKNL